MTNKIFNVRTVFLSTIFFLFIQNNILGTTIPPSYPVNMHGMAIDTKPIEKLPGIIRPDIKLIEQLLGRKLKFKEKIVLKILQLKLNRRLQPTGRIVTTNYGKTAFILALIGAAVLLIPILDLASIPLAILAIVLGSKARKIDPRDRKARAAVTIGIATLALLVIIGLVVALVLTIGSFPR
jgi:hypothetical protein